MDSEAVLQVLKTAYTYIFFSDSKANLIFYLWSSWIKYKMLVEAWSQTHLQDYYKALKKIIKETTGKDRN